MYDLFIANKNYSSWSLRPWMLMRQLGIPFNERIVRFEEDSSREAFRKYSPSGQVPCLKDGETMVWESIAIVEYLAERHERVWPADAAARAWARSAAAEMHSGFSTLRSRCPMSCGVRIRLHEVPPELERDIARLGELWNEGLSRFGGPFLAGKTVTGVDALFAPVAFRIQSYGLILDDASASYAARLRDLPSMRSWYEAGLAETWRPASHELELADAGTMHEDLRAKPA